MKVRLLVNSLENINRLELEQGLESPSGQWTGRDLRIYILSYRFEGVIGLMNFSRFISEVVSI